MSYFHLNSPQVKKNNVTGTLMPIRILVVDDEEDMQELFRWRFRRNIKKQEYEFGFVTSAEEALSVLRSDQEIDIILCDINMPGTNGLVLLERIKNLPRTLKTIMVTAYGNMDNIRSAMNGGAFDFVTKPIDVDDLKTTIQKGFEELAQLRAGKLAQEQLPLTQQALEETDQKARQLAELDELKTRFFTNISHEFRTPLTVIQGIADHIVENPQKWLTRGHQVIQRNTGQLLDLVNQILELRKLEMGKMVLKMEQIEAIAFLRYLTASFQSVAETRGVKLSFQSNVDTLWMDIDTEKILRILTNLLSNALKFTAAGGDIRVLVEQQDSTHLRLMVQDTGIGIPEDRLPQVFDRFYQVDDTATREHEGTGIGLALTRELVQLMQGTIEVESRKGNGSLFKVTLPISTQAERGSAQPYLSAPTHLMKPEAELDVATPTEDERPILLVIEDNADVVEYLRAILDDTYQLLIARNGQQGIDLAQEQVPDLIISDVMMPEKDGFEVCETLKTDQRTSHIPIVLLTARADDDSRIQGLSHGADAYLPKPFQREELFVRLAKLLEIRQNLRDRYQGSVMITPEPSEPFQQEDAFLKKVRETVEANLNESYNIPALCQLLGISRTNLHRKLKALTGDSSTIFIRRIRLNRATELLQNSELNITEIAYEVGFNDSGYFSKSFIHEFGLTPRDYREKHQR